MTAATVVDATDVPKVREALRQLEPLLQARPNEPVLVRDGNTVFAVFEVPLRRPDAETRALSQNPQFNAMMEHARQQFREGLFTSRDELLRELQISDDEIAAAQTRRRKGQPP
jgi:hypothetical protein